jgi:hypothetical protein
MRLVHSVSDPLHRERAMPEVIAVGSRSSSTWFVRVVEHVIARMGWLAGRVPSGVTPRLATSRWWR